MTRPSRLSSFVPLGATSVATLIFLACGSDESRPAEGPAIPSGPDAGGTTADVDGGSNADGAVAPRTCTRGTQHRVSSAPGDSILPTLAAGPSGAAVAWFDARTAPARVYFATLGPDAQPSSEVLIPWSLPIPVASEPPAVAWGGNEWLAAWTAQSKLYVRRFDASSAPLGDLIEHAVPVQGYRVALAGNGSGHGALWTTGTSISSDGDLYFAALDAQGAMVGTVVKVTTSAFNEDVPLIVWNGTGYGIAWRDSRGASKQSGFRELDVAGQPTGAESFSASGLDSVGPTSLAWTGSGYAIGWNKDGANLVALVDRAGNVVKGPKQVPAVKGSGSSGPNLAWHDGFLGVAYAWKDRTAASERAALFFVELDSNLETSSPLLSIPQGADGQGAMQPSLAATKDGYAIAWSGVPAWDVFANTIVCQ